MESAFSFIFGLALIALALVILFIPGIVASKRKHNNRMAIWVCTIIGLFTGVFWFVALIWECTDNVERSDGNT